MVPVHELVSWRSNVELEAIESQTMDSSLFLALSPDQVSCVSLVEFALSAGKVFFLLLYWTLEEFGNSQSGTLSKEMCLSLD